MHLCTVIYAGRFFFFLPKKAMYNTKENILIDEPAVCDSDHLAAREMSRKEAMGRKERRSNRAETSIQFAMLTSYWNSNWNRNQYVPWNLLKLQPILWNILSLFLSQMRLASSLLMFQKSLKIWLCHQGWGGGGGIQRDPVKSWGGSITTVNIYSLSYLAFFMFTFLWITVVIYLLF